jgi:hypothetical protein
MCIYLPYALNIVYINASPFNIAYSALIKSIIQAMKHKFPIKSVYVETPRKSIITHDTEEVIAKPPIASGA